VNTFDQFSRLAQIDEQFSRRSSLIKVEGETLMKTKRIVTAVTAILFLTIAAGAQTVQTGKQYEDMSRAERLGFVGEQARRIAREISGSEYEFTAAFEQDIQKFVTHYAQRIGKNRNERGPVTDLRVVMQRGQSVAPTVNAVFRARNVSPLVGLYLAWIESEYQNLDTPSPGGAFGMFQFLPSTGERYDLSAEDLLDVAKSADAAARYITDSMQVFNGDPMKEVLALLAYNRGEGKTSRELKVVLTEQNKRCSICALTAERTKLDETFRSESVFYVPRFFAAAIIGENPHVFGIQGQPLSSH
jgi:soluble lytic murein transglycosylase-like protein